MFYFPQSFIEIISYIINRSVSFPPQSGGTFEPGVLRLLRFSLQDATDGESSGWLDGSTMRFAFVFHNKGAAPLNYVPMLPASMFRRCRVLVAGVETRYTALREMRGHVRKFVAM
jgi:hypothetical protein